jgi:hypothetical protein
MIQQVGKSFLQREVGVKINDLNLNDIWSYSEESASGIKWKINVYAGKNNNILRAKINDCAGTKNSKCWRVVYKGVGLSVHRLVWVLNYGEITNNLVVDHLDGNPFNNQINNLRLVPVAVNTRNTRLPTTNTSGIKGVMLHQGKYWKAQWYEEDGVKCKYFSMETYGFEMAKQLALEYRLNKILELNSRGFGYTERHLHE